MHVTPERWPERDIVFVSLDVETTGLDPKTDTIIEFGAVKARNGEVLDRFSTFVNPGRPIPQFVQGLTGIRDADVANAPPMSQIIAKIQAFIGDAPVVGHNIGFDVGFLRQGGVRVSGPPIDTVELAPVLLPSLQGYALGSVANELGAPMETRHRALADAETTLVVLYRLLDKFRSLPPTAQAEMRRLADRSPEWSLRHLFKMIVPDETLMLRGGDPGLEGLDVERLAERLKAAGTLKRVVEKTPINVERLRTVLADGGALSKTLEVYEHRDEQEQMAGAVAKALNETGQLVVEAGTGTGKSLAYLLPAALFAYQNGERVVVSTNTINLQEQLVTKDIPDAQRALAAEGLTPEGLRVAVLKGRANYLCLRRWSVLKQHGTLSPTEARTLAKVLVWLQTSTSGDRGELNVTQGEAAVWNRLSAQDYDQASGPCPFSRRSLCFYQAARRRAEGAHIVVVNHALLALDAVYGTLVPDYKHLIIDEAHNLEEVVTNQWGDAVDGAAMHGVLDRIVGGTGGVGVGLLAPMIGLSRSGLLSEARRNDVAVLVKEIQEEVKRARGVVSAVFKQVADFTLQAADRSDANPTLRITQATRTQPVWVEIEKAWENANLGLVAVMKSVDRLNTEAGRSNENELPDREGYLLEIGALQERGRDVMESLKAAIANPDQQQVYWVTINNKDGSARLQRAPLHVGPELEERLFSQKETVVLTSATLAVEHGLTYVKDRLKLEEASELLLGSPFDYPKAVLMYLPSDIPPPQATGYQEAVAAMVADAARAARGRTMVLFTGWTALRQARERLAAPLATDGITVLAQGVDGTPQQLIEQFRKTPNTLLLGTGSFWEGVDIAGEALSVLMITRLPFNVPTEPVFAARSQLFDDPFTSYAIPQAVLRFKQGFGRLIRRKTDRGVLVVLDRRVTSKAYGAAFLDSIPKCTRRIGPARNVGFDTQRWLSQLPLEPNVAPAATSKGKAKPTAGQSLFPGL
ncbi:MAG: hypothetical protein HY261_02390 [Chloroflexi bacterium]|nr:hypothetical protein [Chloroflexota bacterium]